MLLSTGMGAGTVGSVRSRARPAWGRRGIPHASTCVRRLDLEGADALADPGKKRRKPKTRKRKRNGMTLPPRRRRRQRRR